MDPKDPTTTTQDKQVTVAVPEDRVPQFYAFYAHFLAAGEHGRRGPRGRRGPGGRGPGGHGRCGHRHPEDETQVAETQDAAATAE